MNKRENGMMDSTWYEYDTLMNMLHVSVSKHLLDDHFTLIWANDFYYELIGYSRAEYEAVYHNQCDTYYINEELGIHDEKLWNQLGEEVVKAFESGTGGYSVISRIRRKNGDYIWVQMQATFIDEYIDGCQVSYTAMTDITDIIQMRIEQSITYDNMPGFVAKYRVKKELSFVLIDANQKFLDFFGEDSWKNEEYSVYRSNVERNQAVFLEHKEELLAGKPVHFTVKMCDKLGNDAWLQINAACIDYQDGDPVYLVIYIDITNVKELQLQAQQESAARKLAEEANRAKSEFFSRMSHDIRTPLNAIIGMRDIAAAHVNDKEKVIDCLHKIGHSSHYLLELINNVLDMSKIESGKIALRSDSISLPDVMENIVSIMQPMFKEKEQSFSIRLQNVAHEQFCSDALRLQQIFLNILSNACKFTPVGGSIIMDVKESGAQASDTALFTFTIADTGIGMQPEFLEHIFDSFSRERDSRVDKTEGTGLGMAITKKVVELLGGSIDVSSQLGEGTTFCVELPLKMEDTPLFDEHFPDLKIIVVDDDAVMCEYTVQMLGELGVHAEWVDSGIEAVEKIEEALQSGAFYDAVLLDWKMPGQDGLETTRRIRSLCGDKLPILIVSAYDWGDIEKQAREAGVTGFLSKPVFVSTLCRGLQKYVLGKEPTIPDRNAQLRSINFSGKRFLLVEDNALNREVAMELLSDAGAVIDIACDGKQGVEAFSLSKPGYYDMLLMDIQMPVMNGYTAAKEIRSQNREDARVLPILAMTADAFAEDIIAAKEAGMNGHLAKPLDEATLKREIGKYLNL